MLFWTDRPTVSAWTLLCTVNSNALPTMLTGPIQAYTSPPIWQSFSIFITSINLLNPLPYTFITGYQILLYFHTEKHIFVINIVLLSDGSLYSSHIMPWDWMTNHCFPYIYPEVGWLITVLLTYYALRLDDQSWFSLDMPSGWMTNHSSLYIYSHVHTKLEQAR